ncbi:MAG: Cas9 endonuclease PAM-interacting domain-containing protein, partial [Clostridia bacterium]
MMSDKKFARLTRTEYSERDIEGFISRQLNETRYTSKLVAHLLEQLYYPEGNKNVKFVKANIVSTFRHEQGLKKVRDVNDFHHAHDAYLNVVVGNLLFTKFGNEINRNFATKLFYDAINNKKREQDIINTVISSDILVGAGIDGAKMRMYATSTKIQVVKRVSEGCGAFYEQNLTGKKEGLVPIKSSGEFSDTTKYGGYNGINPAYFSIIRHTKKGERLTSIIRIPLYRAAGIGDDLAKLKSYLEAPDIGRDAYVDVEIVRAKMPKYQLLNYNGSYVWIVGNAQGKVELANANQLIVDKSMQSIISNICEANKLMTMDKKAKCVIDRSINFKENDLISAFNYLTSKISAKPFNLLYTPVCNVLINSDEIFKQLNSLDKLHIIQCL